MKSISTFFVSTKNYVTIFFNEPKTVKASSPSFKIIRTILKQPLIITLSKIVTKEMKEKMTNKKATFKLFRKILNNIKGQEYEILYKILKSSGAKKIKEKIMEDIYQILKSETSKEIDGKVSEYQKLTEDYIKVLLTPAEIIEKKFKGTWLSVKDGALLYDNKKVNKKILDNDELIKMVLETAQSDKPEMNIIKFLDKLLSNPKKDIVNELFDFLKNGKFIIHEDGRFSAYKKVAKDYKDIYSGKIDNSPGKTLPKLNYEDVDFDRNNVCSFGYHFCAYDYLSSYGNIVDSKIVEVRIDPKDVIAIPTDYNFMKGRCLTYEVIRDITGEGDCLNEDSEDYKSELDGTNDEFDSDEDCQEDED